MDLKGQVPDQIQGVLLAFDGGPAEHKKHA
jgi:hypothetical protein